MAAEQETFASRLAWVEEEIRRTAKASGRSPERVKLVAVSKTHPAERLQEAFDAGCRRFGENYIQEALAKMDRLPTGIEWHMIGALQSNKARHAVGAFDLIHTLDRPSLADALEKAAASKDLIQPVLLQANLAGEATKAGADAENALLLARRAAEWPHLSIRGLMAIPPYEEEAEHSRPHFRALRELAEKIAALGLPGVAMDELSMGMSHDFAVAVEEGATLVRVGSALFGERPPKAAP